MNENFSKDGNLGGKIKKPFYKKWWFIVICIIVLIGLLSDSEEKEETNKTYTEEEVSKLLEEQSKKEEISKEENELIEKKVEKVVEVKKEEKEVKKKEEINPIKVTVDELYNQLDSNALKASNLYKDKYVEVTGILSSIDSDGKNFLLNGESTGFFQSLYVSISKSHKEDVKQNLMEYSEGDTITIYGKITRVGETLGYSLSGEKVY